MTSHHPSHQPHRQHSRRLVDYFGVCGLSYADPQIESGEDEPDNEIWFENGAASGVLLLPPPGSPRGSLGGSGSGHHRHPSMPAFHPTTRHDIMDITIHLPDEVLPPGYSVLAQTIGGNRGNLDSRGYFDRGSYGAFICYARRGPGDQGPAIADVAVLAKGEAPPPGYTLVEHTVSGKPLKEVAIAVRRQQYDAQHRYFEDRAVTGLYLVCPAKGEALPTAAGSHDHHHQQQHQGPYHLLDETVTFRSGRHKLFLAYRKADAPLGLCDVTFKGEVLDRFPRRDHHDFALPHDVLPMFSYPKGIRVRRVKADKPPEPSYCSYVLTDENGRNYFIGSITIYEPLNAEMTAQVEAAIRKEALRRGRYRDHVDAVRLQCLQAELAEEKRTAQEETKKEEGAGAGAGTGGAEGQRASAGRQILVAPKVLLVVSHWPILRFMKKWLSQVYVLSMMQNPVPLERCIEHFVHQIPVPEAGGPVISLQLHDAMDPIVLARPRLQGLPFIDLGFAPLFQCLDVGNVLTVLALLLQERKVLMVCRHESVLAEVMEAFRALLFPFKWESCYVPRLTESMIGCVEFPGGFFLGLKDDSEEPTAGGSGSSSSSATAGGSGSMLVRVQQLLQDTDDVILVDLSRNLVTSASPRLPVTFKSLPSKLRQTLQTRWTLTLAEAELLPGAGFASNPDHHLDFPGMGAAPTRGNKDAKRSLDDRAIRDGALCCMLALMRGYRDYLVAPDLNHGYREIFDKKAFVTQCVDKPNRSFVSKMMGTQLFSSFIQRRMEASDPSILFFDHCMNLYASSPETWDSAQQKHLLFVTSMKADSSSSSPGAMQGMDGSSELAAPVALSSSPSSSAFSSVRSPAAPKHRLLIDRVESLKAAAAPPARVSSPSLAMMTRSSSIGASISSTTTITAPARTPSLLPLALTKRASLFGVSSSYSANGGGAADDDQDDEPERPTLRASALASSPNYAGEESYMGEPAAVREYRPSTEGLPAAELYSYCDHGFLAWPRTLNDGFFTGARVFKDEEDGGPQGHQYHHDGHMAGLLLTRTHLELTQDAVDLSRLGSSMLLLDDSEGHDGDATLPTLAAAPSLGSAALSSPSAHGGQACVFQMAKCMGVHFFGSWFMCVPLLVLAAPEAEKEDLIVRAFGALAGMQAERQLVPDETIYRALLVACIRGGDANCHRSDAVRLLKELTELGIKPNAITYGQYTRAIAEDYARRHKDEGAPPPPLDLMLRRAGSIYQTFLDGSRRDAWVKGDLWRRGLDIAGADAHQHPHHRRHQPGGHHRRMTSAAPPGGGASGSEGVGGGLDRQHQHQHQQHHRQRSGDPLGLSGSGGKRASMGLLPTFAPSQASIATSWSFTLPAARAPAGEGEDEEDDVLEQLQDAGQYAIVGMWSGTDHGHEAGGCPHVPLDEEVMASWGSGAKGEDGMDMVACPRCHDHFAPRLEVRCSAFSAELLERAFPDSALHGERGEAKCLVLGSNAAAGPQAETPLQQFIKRQSSFKGLAARAKSGSIGGSPGAATAAGEGAPPPQQQEAAADGVAKASPSTAELRWQIASLLQRMAASSSKTGSREGSTVRSITSVIEGFAGTEGTTGLGIMRSNSNFFQPLSSAQESGSGGGGAGVPSLLQASRKPASSSSPSSSSSSASLSSPSARIQGFFQTLGSSKGVSRGSLLLRRRSSEAPAEAIPSSLSPSRAAGEAAEEATISSPKPAEGIGSMPAAAAAAAPKSAAAAPSPARLGKYHGATLHQVTTGCSYMSPATLRLSLEHLIQEHGEHALYRETMLELCPDVFWNLWWYSARFGLPLPLPSRDKAAAAAGPQMMLVAGWDGKLVERAAQAACIALQAFDDQALGESLRAKLVAAATAVTSAGVSILPSRPSSSSLDALANSTSASLSHSLSHGLDGAVRERAMTKAAAGAHGGGFMLTETLIKQVFRELRCGSGAADEHHHHHHHHSPQDADAGQDLAGIARGAVHTYLEGCLGKARDAPLGELRALLAKALREGGGGELAPAMRFFLRQRQRDGDKGPFAQQSMYRVLLYLASNLLDAGAGCRLSGRRGRGLTATAAQGTGTVAGACRIGAGGGSQCHESCTVSPPAGSMGGSSVGSGHAHQQHHRVAWGDFDKMFARACEELSPEERALLWPADGVPKDEALASRSVFGHLF